jgi:DNA-directed RNA polymerase specialized sigma24 family protein
VRRNLRGGDDLRAWMTSIERRVIRQERRGQTVLQGAPASTLAVPTIADIPEGTSQETHVVLLESGGTAVYEAAASAWVESS